jgi:hypothetical protein
MKHSLLAAAIISLSLPTLAGAEEPKAPAAAGPDMSKMGPWSRKPKNEKQVKKEILDFFKQEEELAKKGDFDGSVARIDFPVFMVTDDASGVPEADAWNKEKYTAQMKPFWDNMPKDMKVTHKPTIVILSDSLATITDDFTMTMGKQKFSGRNSSMVVKRDGQWKWKTMAEAGWGGMSEPQAAMKGKETTPTAKK